MCVPMLFFPFLGSDYCCFIINKINIKLAFLTNFRTKSHSLFTNRFQNLSSNYSNKEKVCQTKNNKNPCCVATRIFAVQSEISFYFLWHIPEDGQFLQPHPQDVFPAFLSFNNFIATAVITATTITETKMVPPYLAINSIIFYAPFYAV